MKKSKKNILMDDFIERRKKLLEDMIKSAKGKVVSKEILFKDDTELRTYLKRLDDFEKASRHTVINIK